MHAFRLREDIMQIGPQPVRLQFVDELLGRSVGIGFPPAYLRSYFQSNDLSAKLLHGCKRAAEAPDIRAVESFLQSEIGEDDLVLWRH